MLKSITNLEVANKRVLVRIDLNLPRKDGIILDYTRIERSLQTINYLKEQGAKIIIISHLGRPKGKYDMELSLAPIADSLEKFLGQKVNFASNIFDEKLIEKTSSMKNGDVLLLENLRFNKGEEQNDEIFTRRLAELADCYVNDSFSCSHRAHASIYGIAKILPSAAGFLLQSELNNIQQTLSSPEKPMLAIIGGSKVSTKLALLKKLVTKTNYLVIAGAMANTFLKAKNINIGSSLFEEDLLEDASEILNLAEKYGCEIVLPEDFLVGKSLDKDISSAIYKAQENFTGKIFDIGPDSLTLIEKTVENSSTIIWNGPLGAFETQIYDLSSRQLARFIAAKTKYDGKISIAGGGDTLAVIKTTGLADSFTYISTGGGAFLEWLEGKILPGVEVLKITSSSVNQQNLLQIKENNFTF